MNVKEFSERVAHYCDELQIEEESYFYTVINGALLEVTERFPVVGSHRYEIGRSNSQTIVNMNELVPDFASFSTPAVKADENSPNGRPFTDARTGEIIFLAGDEGVYTIYYNKRIPPVTRDTVELPLDGERLELLILGVAYRLLTIDADYNAASYVKMIYEEYAARIDERKESPICFENVTGW